MVESMRLLRIEGTISQLHGARTASRKIAGLFRPFDAPFELRGHRLAR